MELTDLTAYLVLAAMAHSAARVATDLVPAPREPWRRLIHEWLSSGVGVALAFGTGVDLLAELGMTVAWPPAGFIMTGLLLGPGTKFGIPRLQKMPKRGAA